MWPNPQETADFVAYTEEMQWEKHWRSTNFSTWPKKSKLKSKLKLLTANRRQRNNKSFNLLILKKTGKINFWNMFFFNNCAIESRANGNTYNNRPMIINAPVAWNSPNWEYGNASYTLHYFKNWCKYTSVIYN